MGNRISRGRNVRELPIRRQHWHLGPTRRFVYRAEPRTARDRACADRRCLGRDELVAQTLVRPLLMIMLDKRSYGSPEVPFAEWHDPLQALELGGPNKPLRKRVQIWTPGRQDQWLHATAPQQAPKAGGVEW